MSEEKAIKKNNNSLHPMMIQLNNARELAESIKLSEYGKAFERDVKGEDGKTIKVINTDDIIANIMIGAELGLPYMKSIMYGNTLNKDSIFAVDKGKAFGLDLITSLENIHVITANGKKQTITGIHIITSVLLKNGIQTEIIKNYSNYYRYYNAVTNEELEDDDTLEEDGSLKLKFFAFIKGITSDAEVKTSLAEGKIMLIRKLVGKYTLVKFTRKLTDDYTKVHFEKFTTKMGEDEGFLPVVNAQGQSVGGKQNWIRMPHIMFLDRAIGRGARTIAPDLIHGTYTEHEAHDVYGTTVKHPTVDIAHEEIKD